MNIKASGAEPGQRQLNGPQTTGGEYHSLGKPEFDIKRSNDVAISRRDGTKLLSDLFQPDAEGRFPPPLSVSPYPRQIQDFGVPFGLLEAGTSDFLFCEAMFRGYVQLIVNLRGTGGSEGAWTFQDQQERDDLFDLVEWAAAQPWCDGMVGMLGISYFPMTQLAAAVMQPPHLKAIFPLAVSDDPFEDCWHNGLLSSGFISAWIPATGITAARDPQLWRKDFFKLIKQMSVEHPARDAFWDARNQNARLGGVRILVYLGCDWDNVPMQASTRYTARRACFCPYCCDTEETSAMNVADLCVRNTKSPNLFTFPNNGASVYGF
jgi:putative CocE/NonD family hydrolase